MKLQEKAFQQRSKIFFLYFDDRASRYIHLQIKLT